MKIHQIRNATIIVTYNDKRFLVDPWLMPKDYMAGFEVAVNADVRQPRTELPLPIDEIVQVDAVILTHFHPDHWDEFAANALDKNIPFFVQSETDVQIIKSFGFTDLRVISEKGTDFHGITLYKTGCQHGKREIIKPICEQVGLPYDSMGIVFKAKNEKVLYIAGDTIWCPEVQTAVDQYTPDVIVVNACGATLLNGEKIIMDAKDVQTVAEYCPKAFIVASHMDTVSHLTVSKDDIKNLNLENVLVPDDDEIITFD